MTQFGMTHLCFRVDDVDDLSALTEQHGGTVSADNAPDGGAVFKLSLPVTPATAAEAREVYECASQSTEIARPRA